MPQTIAFLILPYIAPYIASLSMSLGALTGIITAISYGIQAIVTVGLTVAANMLAGALAPQPKPQDRQSVIRQAAQPRFRSYGRVKIGGVLAFLSTKNGRLYRVIVTGQGEIDEVEEHWIDSNLIAIDGSGAVTSPPKYVDRVTVQYKLGTASQTAYADLITEFPTLWSSDHKGNDIPHALIVCRQVKAEKFGEVYPRGEPLYRQVQRASKVWNPLDPTQDPDDATTWKWSDNAALVILDYLTHADGLGLSRDFMTTTMAADLWEDAINSCEEPIALASGGTEPRYRIWSSYGFDERPADILARFLSACDGIMAPTPDGGIAIRVGQWIDPVMTVGSDAIIAYDITHGRDILSTANTIRSQYTSPFHDYQAVDADPWTDDADVTARGEFIREVQFHAVPSHSQCRRLMKVAAKRANPSWTGTLTCNLSALPALGERFVTIEIDELGISETFEILNCQWALAEESTLRGVILTVASIDSTAYDWDEATEEGTAPAVPDDLEIGSTLDPPENFDVTIQQRTITGGVVGAVGVLTWDDFAADLVDLLEVEARYKLTSETEWIAIPVATDAVQTETGFLIDGEEYEFQVRTVSETGRVSDWTDSVTKTVTVDSSAPGSVTSLVATGGAGQVAISFTAPGSANFYRAAIYRNTTASQPGSPFTYVYGAPSANLNYTDTGLAAGTYYYWVTAQNGSAVESAAAASGSVTVT